MERKKGFFNIDEYFDRLLNREGLSPLEYYNLPEKLGLIKYYKKNKFYQYYIEINGCTYFFKYNSNPYYEVIASLLGKKLGFNVIDYELATFLKKEGCISKYFFDKSKKHIDCYTLLRNYYQSHKEEIKSLGYPEDDNTIRYYLRDLNSLELIEKAVDYYFKSNSLAYNDYIRTKIMDDILDQYIFAVLTGQRDKSSINIEIEYDDTGIKVLPIFDNEDSFASLSLASLHVNAKDNLTNYVISLETFFDIYPKDIIDRFLTKESKLTEELIDEVFSEVEAEYQISLPDFLKTEIRANYRQNLKCINSFIEKRLMQNSRTLE